MADAPFLAFLATMLLPLATSSPLIARDSNQVGLQWAHNISFGGCDAGQQATVLTAMGDAVTLSSSAIAALKFSPYYNPATYFFPSTFAQTAIGVFQTVNDAIQPDPTQTYTGLNDIWLYCTDIGNKCDDQVPGPSGEEPLLGYVPDGYNPATGMGTATSPALFVVCPAMLALPRNPAPCTHTAGAASLGWAFLRTFVTLRSVQPGYPKLAATAIADHSPGVSASHALTAAHGGGAYDENADNFAELGLWSYLLDVTDAGVQCKQDCGNMGPGATC